MNRLRLATWAAVAGLGLLAGCRSTNPCDPCEQQQGFFSRLCGRRNGSLCGSVVGTPVSSMSLGGDCCEGGPVLGDPPFAGVSGPVMHGGFDSGMALPPISTSPDLGFPPGAIAPPLSAPPLSMPPMTALPAPTPSGPPPLAPVPNGNGLATPTPAGPSSMSRTR